MKNSNKIGTFHFEWDRETIEYYIAGKKYRKLNKKDIHKKTVFNTACEFYPELITQLLEIKKIKLNSQDIAGNTGFIIACELQPELAIKMLEKNNIGRHRLS